MDQLILFSKAVMLYLLILLPQLRLVGYKYDPHIGNFTTSRVSGKSLASIFFNHNFGVPITALSLSIQYDYFKNKASNYKVFHAIMASSAGPLFYLFTYFLIKNELAAFICSILYAVSFNFPITGSWLIKSEHYENVFFLTGGSLLLASGDSLVLGILGAILMGCCLLCKLPALISVWLIAVICVKHTTIGEFHSMSAIVICYLAPFTIYSIAGRFVPQDNLDNGTASSNIFSIIKDVPSTYLYFYKRNPSAYIKSHVVYHITEYVKQFLPVIILAAFFLICGRHTDKWIIELGLAVVSLIFIIRMGFSFVYSFDIILCIAAGLALFSIPSSLLEIIAALVLPATLFSYFALRKDPYLKAYSGNAASTTACDVLAEYLQTNSKPEETIFCNINYPLAIIHTLSGRGLLCHANILTIGGYTPYIDHTNVPKMINRDGRKLLAVIAISPPKIIIQSCADYPILNLSAIEEYCGVTYSVTTVINNYVIYCLRERREIYFTPDKIDVSFLFNAELGNAETLIAARQFMQLCAAEQINLVVDKTSKYAYYEREYLLNCKKQLMLDRVMGKTTAAMEYYAKLYFYFQDNPSLITEIKQDEELYANLSELDWYFKKIVPRDAVIEIGSENEHLAEIITRLAEMQIIRLRIPCSRIYDVMFDTIPDNAKEKVCIDILMDVPLPAGSMEAAVVAGFYKINLVVAAASALTADFFAMLQAAIAEVENNNMRVTITVVTGYISFDSQLLVKFLLASNLAIDIVSSCACPFYLVNTGVVHQDLRVAMGRTHDEVMPYLCDPRQVLMVKSSGLVTICSNYDAPTFGSVLVQDPLIVWGEHLFCRTRWELMVGLPLPACTGCTYINNLKTTGDTENV